MPICHYGGSGVLRDLVRNIYKVVIQRCEAPKYLLNKRSFAVAQLCIQAHSSSLRCGGSLCKDDKVYGNDGKKRFFGFHPQNDIVKKAAFTLAEVLITLGIIGVVAAMTLPTLIENNRKVELTSRAKKAYSEILQAVKMYEAQNETPGNIQALFEAKNGTADNRQLAEDFSKYFNNPKVCKNRTDNGCGSYFYSIKYSKPRANSEGTLIDDTNNLPKIILPDETVLGIGQNAMCNEYKTVQNTDEYGRPQYDDNGEPIMGHYYSACAYITFDTNGPKRPNTFGLDAFRLKVSPEKVYIDASDTFMGAASLSNLLTNGELIFTDYTVGGSLDF